MAEEKDGRTGAETPDDIEEQARRDRADQLEMMAETGRVLRRGGLVLALLIALMGWYLSREGGVWFLVGGVAFGALTGGGLALSGAVGGAVMRKYLKHREGDEDKRI